MEIYLVRHGQSQYNVGLTEFLDSDLTPVGTRQAQLTAQRLAHIAPTRILCSPLRRTLQTALPLASRLNIPAELCPLMCEYFSSDEYRTFPGLLMSQIFDQYPFAVIPSGAEMPGAWWPSGPETLEEIVWRVTQVKQNIHETWGSTQERVVVISHADTLGRLCEVLTATKPDPDQPPWNDNCGITLLRSNTSDGPAELVYANDISHLEPIQHDQ